MVPVSKAFPENPSTQSLRSLVLKTIPQMVFWTRILKYWVLGPSGNVLATLKAQVASLPACSQVASKVSLMQAWSLQRISYGPSGFLLKGSLKRGYRAT